MDGKIKHKEELSIIRRCRECGQSLKGRSDKKYCSGHCRSAYHNRVNTASKRLIRQINRVLSRNYKILSDLKSSGRKRVSRNELLLLNFGFQYCTSVRLTQDPYPIYHIYDLEYTFIDDSEIRLF